MSSDIDWIVETVGDFIHSRIWLAPVYTFIEANCLAFDYEDEVNDDDDDDEVNDDHDSLAKSKLDEETLRALHDEQQNIFRQYQHLIDSLIDGLGHDLGLDKEQLRKACELPNSNSPGLIDECYEQLYAARDFSLFQEMMRRKNLILQLQALVTLQIQWGLLKPSETGEDLVLNLLLNATKPSTRTTSTGVEVESREHVQSISKRNDNDQRKAQTKPTENLDYDDDDDVETFESRPTPIQKKKEIKPEKPKEVRQLADLRRRPEIDAEWHRKLRDNEQKEQSKTDSTANETAQTLGNVPEDLLREKLRELTIRTSEVDPQAASSLNSRNEFLRQQRDLLLKKMRAERKQDIEQETRNARPQSAAYAANRAMATMTKPNPVENESKPSPQELAKRQALMNKLKKNVVDKH